MAHSNQNTSFSKLRIIKNLIVISISFLLIFTAYDGLGMLQTTMNKEDGVGTVAQAVIHTTYGISSLLLSSFAVKKLGTKNSQLLGMVLYLPYVAANFYPTWVTLVPSAVIIGIGCTLLWGAQCTYFNECSVLYKRLIDASSNCSSNSTETFKTDKYGTKGLSALDLLSKAEGIQNHQGRYKNSPPAFRYIDKHEPGSKKETNVKRPVKDFKNTAECAQDLEEVDSFRNPNFNSSDDTQDIQKKDCESIDHEGRYKNSPPAFRYIDKHEPGSKKETNKKLHVKVFKNTVECVQDLEEINSYWNPNLNTPDNTQDIQKKNCESIDHQGNYKKSPPEFRYIDKHEPEIKKETNKKRSLKVFKKTEEGVQDLEKVNSYRNPNFNSSDNTQVIQKNDCESYEVHTMTDIPKKQNQNSLSSVNALFFGFHGLAYCSAQVWSNLISFHVLNSGGVGNSNKSSNCSCGVGFCNTDKTCVDSKIEEVAADIRNYYTGVCFTSGILAVMLIWLFVDHMERSKGLITLSWTHLFATIEFIKNKEQFFIIPMTVCTSMLQSFYMADFTKSYIACSWSTSQVGMVSVFYGVASALSSLISGVLIRLLGRRFVLIFCQVMNIVSLVFLYLWIPDPDQPFMYYLVGGIYGFIVGIFHSQLKALYGVFFEGDEETAFSSCNIYSSIGWALPFVYGEFFYTSVKMSIMITIACLSLLGYLFAERNFSLRNKETKSVK